jgi:hypothetical protein
MPLIEKDSFDADGSRDLGQDHMGSHPVAKPSPMTNKYILILQATCFRS